LSSKRPIRLRRKLGRGKRSPVSLYVAAATEGGTHNSESIREQALNSKDAKVASNEKPIHVRFLWTRVMSNPPHWEQAFFERRGKNLEN
jgi:hypothetical protein